MLRLGRFLDTDDGCGTTRMHRTIRSIRISRLLTDLVQLAAPWLRGFPTVAAWDDAAGARWSARRNISHCSAGARLSSEAAYRAKDTITDRAAAGDRVLAEAATMRSPRIFSGGRPAIGWLAMPGT